MPSIERPLAGDVLVLDLAEEREQTADAAVLERSGRSARTLIKHGPLRVTLVVVAAGAAVAEHEADGPITIQPVDGEIRFSAGGRDYDLRPGQILSAGPGVRHGVSSSTGGTFLLTVVHPARPADASASDAHPID